MIVSGVNKRIQLYLTVVLFLKPEVLRAMVEKVFTLLEHACPESLKDR